MFNPAVSYVRVFSMLLILVTHYLAWKNINCFQISTVGVSAFLFIFGYLYGIKNIKNKKDFVIQRVERVFVPFWILSAILSIYLLIKSEYIFALQNFLETLFNLQGLHFVFKIPFKLGDFHISGLSHCWFLTIIMTCYILVVAINNSRIEKFVDKHSILCLLGLIMLHLSLSLINVAVGTFAIFFVGYFFKRLETNKNLLCSKYIFAIIALSITALVVRIVLRHHIDDTPIYNLFIAPFASNICAVCFFVIVNQICMWKSSFTSAVAHSSMWGVVDKMTYPLYLTHYMFLKEPFEIVFTQNSLIHVLAFVVLSLTTAFVLKGVSKIFLERFS